MSCLLWSGLLCLSFTWLFTLDLYTLEKDAWWVTLLVLGVLFNTAALRGKIVFNALDKKYSLLLIPLVLCFLILPFPYHLGFIVTGAGLLILFLCPLVPLLSVLASGLIVSGVILIAQSPLGVLYTVFTSYSHNFFWLDGILYRLFSFLDLKVFYSQQVFYIQTIKDLYAFPTTWEKLALFPLLAIWVGSIPLCYLFSQQKIKDTFKLFSAGTIYLTVRYVFMILVFLYLMTFVKYKEEVCRIDIFWDIRVTLLTFLPLIYVLNRIIPFTIKGGLHVLVYDKLAFSSRKRKALAYFSLAFFCLGAVYGFQDPGKEKQGRVLLDEKHSGWEKSTKKMNTEWYGNESGYNFYWMAEFINHHFPLTRNFEEITPTLLSRYDILIIKNATAPFAQSEVDAIREFVENGGGLYLMSEHTNVFGNSTYINPLAEEFGFSFRYDVLFDIEHKFEQLYYPPRLLPHPVVQNVPYFCFKVSCSIQPLSSQCEPIIISRGAKAQDIYYPSGNFYPPVKDHTYMPFGAFLQMVGVKVDKGRVVGFTDSTTYSNFEAFIAGKPELLLATLSWLNRENRWDWLTLLFLTLAVLSFAGGVQTLRREKRESTFYLFLVVLTAFSLASALFVCQLSSYSSFPLPNARIPYTKVVFEQEHGNYELPLKGFTKEREESYEVFYQWVLRVGYYPFTGKTLEEDIQDASMLIIINPDKPFSPDELDRLKNYLQDGGKLLLMDTVTNQSSTAGEVLSYFGMKIKRDRKVSLPASYSTSWMGRMGQDSAFTIEGGEGVLTSADGTPILSTAQVGNGIIAVMTFSQLFTNPPMGGSYRVVPSPQQREIYELQFNILRGLVEGNLKSYF
jgi:hypothetical protein